MTAAPRSRFVRQNGWPIAGEFEWVLHNSTTAVKAGDVVCCLEGCTDATIIRPQDHIFTVIIVLAKLLRGSTQKGFHKEFSEQFGSVTSSPIRSTTPSDLDLRFGMEVPSASECAAVAGKSRKNLETLLNGTEFRGYKRYRWSCESRPIRNRTCPKYSGCTSRSRRALSASFASHTKLVLISSTQISAARILARRSRWTGHS